MEARHGRSRRWIAAIAVALIVVAALGSYGFSRFQGNGPATSSLQSASSVASDSLSVSPSSQSASSPAESTQSAVGIVITGMYADVAAPGFAPPSSNDSSVSDRTTFRGALGETFSVLFEFIYQDCSNPCPGQVTSITTTTPGFVIVGTTPTTPVPVSSCGFLCTDGPSVNSQDGMQAAITVEVMSPQAAYTGPLTLVGHVS